MAADPVPSPCRVVRHRAARRLTLRVSRAGARLTVPPRTGAREIEAFLRDSAGWVADQRARLGPPPTPLAGGDRLALLDDELELVLAPDGRRATVRRDGRRLVASTGAPTGTVANIADVTPGVEPPGSPQSAGAGDVPGSPAAGARVAVKRATAVVRVLARRFLPIVTG